jgi:hypothetical protein
MNKFKTNIPEKSIKYLIICVGIILLAILVGIIPLYRSNINANKDINKLQYQIEEQKGLASIYAMLTKSISNKELVVLPNPSKTVLPLRDANKFQDVFKELTRKSGLTTFSLTPDLTSVASSSTNLLYNAVLKGEFINLRKTLIGLGAVSYVDRIEEISIQQNSDAMEFKIKIWIAISR